MLESGRVFDSQFEGESCIFSRLTSEEKEILIQNYEVTLVKKNDFVYREGEIPTGMQYLKEGMVKLSKEGIGGRGQIIRLITQNSLIGYRSLIAQEAHNGTAIAIEDSVIVTIPSDILYNVLLRNYNFSLSLLQDLSKELGFSHYRTVSLTQKHIRGRLAESILLLIEKYGFEHDNITLRVYLSREDLANLSNMTASNAIRTLSTFASEKVIAMDGRKIKIINMEKLQRISKLG